MKEIKLIKQLPIVNINFEEVKASLVETTNKYKNIIVTEEGLKDCKATQKELAGVRNKIDDYRKEVKKEMEVPIKFFEGQCKELIKLIADAETPIKQGIEVFDNQKREEKKNKALELIKEAIEVHRLEESYASQLTLQDKYSNLSGSVKSVKDDIDLRATSLKQQQEAEKARVEMLRATIESTVESVNATIKTPLKSEDFEKYIKMSWDIKSIVREINSRAELVREAEKPKEEIKAEPIEVSLPAELKPVPPAPIEKAEEVYYYVEMSIQDTKERMAALSNFLKTNVYNYKTIDQRRI